MHKEMEEEEVSKRSAWLLLLGLTFILCLVVGPVPDALAREIMARVGNLNVASVILMTYVLLALSLIAWVSTRFTNLTTGPSFAMAVSSVAEAPSSILVMASASISERKSS